MNISKKTILITGGGSGIGLEITRLLSKRDNNVIIIGRNGEKLSKAADGLANVTTIPIDITNEDDIRQLAKRINENFSDLSIVINNAATLHVYHHDTDANGFEKARDEMTTNYLAIVRLNEVLLPLLKKQREAVIVNITSVVAMVPVSAIPSYSDSKAALRSYTLSLRHELAKTTSIRVVDLVPPLVSTEFSKEIGGLQNGISPTTVAQDLIDGIENNEQEIYVGQAKQLKELYFTDPEGAFTLLNP
jgi:uncharacterized oxidoreductase